MNNMMRVPSTEFGKEVERYQDAALAQAVVVTRNGRDQTVLISADEYRRLKRRDREVLGLADFTDEDIAALEALRPPADSAAFDHEIEL